MEKWMCTVCGYIHTGPLPSDFQCPVCHQPASKFTEFQDPAQKSRYVGTKTEQNLLHAFAGESQVRNKYTFSPSRPVQRALNRSPLSFRIRPTTKWPTLDCGSASWEI